MQSKDNGKKGNSIKKKHTEHNTHSSEKQKKNRKKNVTKGDVTKNEKSNDGRP